MIKILLVDHCGEYEHGKCKCLSFQDDFELAGLGKDDYEAIILAKRCKPDVILLDLPSYEGFRVVPLLKGSAPQAGIIIFMDADTVKWDIYCIYSKYISGYLSRTINSDQLCQAVRTVYCGGCLLVSKLLMEPFLSSNNTTPPIPENITRTELKIITCISKGLTNEDIANQLCLTKGTIRNNISSILQKTGLHDRTQVAVYAIKAGL
jgi:DNA-binding NarL/FixJ family response regulator